METAKQYLIDHPKQKELFFDEKMEGWHYVNQGVYTHSISREEILKDGKNKK